MCSSDLMNGRTKAITDLGEVFDSVDDAEWAIFKRRIKRHFGIELDA